MTETDPNILRAPWSSEQVTALNLFQQRGGAHPFTCGASRHLDQSPVLDATHSGWICPDPACDYTQDWASTLMVERGAYASVAEPPSVAAIVNDLRYVLTYRGNGHAHVRPGIWDDSGKPCMHCARLAVAEKNLAAYDRAQAVEMGTPGSGDVLHRAVREILTDAELREAEGNLDLAAYGRELARLIRPTGEGD